MNRKEFNMETKRIDRNIMQLRELLYDIRKATHKTIILGCIFCKKRTILPKDIPKKEHIKDKGWVLADKDLWVTQKEKYKEILRHYICDRCALK